MKGRIRLAKINAFLSALFVASLVIGATLIGSVDLKAFPNNFELVGCFVIILIFFVFFFYSIYNHTLRKIMNWQYDLEDFELERLLTDRDAAGFFIRPRYKKSVCVYLLKVYLDEALQYVRVSSLANGNYLVHGVNLDGIRFQDQEFGHNQLEEAKVEAYRRAWELLKSEVRQIIVDRKNEPATRLTMLVIGLRQGLVVGSLFVIILLIWMLLINAGSLNYGVILLLAMIGVIVPSAWYMIPNYLKVRILDFNNYRRAITD